MKTKIMRSLKTHFVTIFESILSSAYVVEKVKENVTLTPLSLRFKRFIVYLFFKFMYIKKHAADWIISSHFTPGEFSGGILLCNFYVLNIIYRR